MANLRTDWDRFLEVYNDTGRYPRTVDVAVTLGMSTRSVRRWANAARAFRSDVTDRSGHAELTASEIAAERGESGFKPVLDGFVIKQTSTQMDDKGVVERQWVQQKKEPGEEFDLPDGHMVKGVSALVDPQGRVLAQWIKTRAEMSPFDYAEALRGAFAEFEGRAAPLAEALPPAVDPLLTLIPCNDWHIGMFAWGRETGIAWDLKIAERVIGTAIEDLISRTPQSGTAIVLGGGDLLHADNAENRTAKSGNQLDVDGRYPKVLESACRLMVRTIDAARARHNRVIVRILPGNHDDHSSVAIAYFLLAWYRDVANVEVDTDPGLFFWHRFGSVFLGATHGHTVKLKDMAPIMAHRRAEDWGLTKFRYVHGFHIHHKEKLATEGMGVISEAHQAPIPQDAWHYGAGFLSGRSLQAITYHERYGETSRARVAILDDVGVLPRAA